MTMMKAVQITKPNEAEICEIPKPVCGPDDVLIKVMASGICGTDIHILEGDYMGAYPVIPGHEFAGVAEAVGDRVKRIKLGERVAVEPNIACDNCAFCLNNQQNFCENWQATGVSLPGGMAEYVAVPEKAVFSIGDLDYEEGAFVEPLSCVLYGLQKTQIRLSDRVIILGAGPIGLLLLQAIRIQGAGSITVCEKDPARAQAARTHGADQVITDLEKSDPRGYDVVVDATGVIPVMNKTLDLVKKGGSILLFGVPPKTNVAFNAFDLFLKSVTIHTSFTSVRNSLQSIALLQNKRIEVKSLISHRLPLDKFIHGVDLIRYKQEEVKKVMILPNNGQK